MDKKTILLIVLLVIIAVLCQYGIIQYFKINDLNKELIMMKSDLDFYKDQNDRITNVLEENIIYNPAFQMMAFLHKYYPEMPPSEKLEYIELFANYSIQENIPVILLADICKRESDFDPKAIGKRLPSGYRARGLFQIHPKYWMDLIKEIGYNKISDLHKPEANIYAGTKIFKQYYNDTQNISDTLKKYVGGDHKNYINDIVTSYTDNMIWLYQLSNEEIQIIIGSNQNLIAKLN